PIFLRNRYLLDNTLWWLILRSVAISLLLIFNLRRAQKRKSLGVSCGYLFFNQSINSGWTSINFFMKKSQSSSSAKMSLSFLLTCPREVPERLSLITVLIELFTFASLMELATISLFISS